MKYYAKLNSSSTLLNINIPTIKTESTTYINVYVKVNIKLLVEVIESMHIDKKNQITFCEDTQNIINRCGENRELYEEYEIYDMMIDYCTKYNFLFEHLS